MLPKNIRKLNKCFKSGELTPVEALSALLTYMDKPDISSLNAFNYRVQIDDECTFKEAEK